MKPDDLHLGTAIGSGKRPSATGGPRIDVASPLHSSAVQEQAALAPGTLQTFSMHLQQCDVGRSKLRKNVSGFSVEVKVDFEHFLIGINNHGNAHSNC